MRILYLDCFSGISGDMCLGALVDAGADSRILEGNLRRLPLHGWEMKVTKKSSRGITGTKIDIIVTDGHQPHRHFTDIRKIIMESSLPDVVRVNSLKIFQRLAEAESKVHGVPADHVHFHEVGGVDSIIDIVGTALALYHLQIERVVCSPVPTGSGTVKTMHGLLPVPAPATAHLLKGVPLRHLNVEGELVTPTGAAIATTLSEDFGPLPGMSVEAVGYGFGSKDYGIPNFLRVFTGDSEALSDSYNHETVLVVETNVDDITPEIAGHVMERLFLNKALDVFITPVYMKKNRPGWVISVICLPGHRDSILKILFEETSTLGIRWREEKRAALDRRIEELDTPYGKIRVKLALSHGGAPLKASPEYEDCKKIALEKGIPLIKIYEAALQAANRI
ncbi:MAG: nickel pincer cofactor biosynthesis protein LarC [Bacillota bacterium]